MKKCIICGSSLADSLILHMDNMPASAQDIPSQKELPNDRGMSLELCQCKVCGLVQFDCEPVGYYKDVIRAGGFTSTMVNLRRMQYGHFINSYGLQHKKVIEVGCGQGEFLEVLTEFPVEAYGMEHRQELVAKARAKGLNVWKAYAGRNESKWENGPFDAFLSFNYLEHQPDPNGMLQNIYDNLTDQGMGLITVPSFEYILENDGYYELLRDHIAYYTFGTLRFLLERNGFEVLEQEVVNRDTLAVIVRKRVQKAFDGLKDSFRAISQEMDTFVRGLQECGKTLAVWGASHQGFTITATTEIGKYARYIIDSAPFKQGKYAPASHLPIKAPSSLVSERVDAILIIAPGYTDEISGIIRKDMELEADIYALRSNHIERL